MTPSRTPSSLPPSKQSSIGPLIAAAAAVIVVAGGALIWFVAHTIGEFLRTHPGASRVLGWLLFLFVVAVVLAAFALVVIGAIRMWHRRDMVTPREDGALPVSLKTIKATGLDVLQAQTIGRATLENARRTIPQGVHTVTHAFPNQPQEADVVEVVDAEIVRDVPPLSTLLREGIIRPGQFCIGWDGEQYVYGTWEDFCTIGAGGTMGTGKSNDGAFYLAQVLAVGGQGYVADPNAGHSQSLANRLGRMAEMLAQPVAKSPEDILKLVRLVRRILAERIAVNYEGEVPAILLVDEFTACMLDDDLAEELPKLLSIINTQGRKYGVFVFLLAQLWGAEMTGGTKVRNLLAGRICHNLPMQEARNLLGLPASSMPADIGNLRRGECYVRTLTGALHRVTIPLVDAEGVADLRRRVAVGQTGAPSPDLRSTFAGPSLRVVEALPGTEAEGGPESDPESALSRWAEILDYTPLHLRRTIEHHQETKTAAQIPALIDEKAKGGDRRMLAQEAIAEVTRANKRRA